jgi:hypothetical protein
MDQTEIIDNVKSMMGKRGTLPEIVLVLLRFTISRRSTPGSNTIGGPTQGIVESLKCVGDGQQVPNA